MGSWYMHDNQLIFVVVALLWCKYTNLFRMKKINREIESEIHNDLLEFIRRFAKGDCSVFAEKIGSSPQNVSRLLRANEDGSYPTISRRFLNQMIKAFPNDFNEENAPSLFRFYKDEYGQVDYIAMERADRLREIYSYLLRSGAVTSKSDFAFKSNFSVPTVSSALSGNKSYITAQFVERVNEAFGNIFNEEWILKGKGEMLKNPNVILNAHITSPIIENNNLDKNMTILIETVSSQQELIKKLLAEIDVLREKIDMYKSEFAKKIV